MNTNQKIKADAGKARLDLVPHGVIWAIARVREYGCNKYPGSPENWRDVEIWRYRAAAFRHLLRYLENPRGLDEESGLPHLHHLACNVAFLVDLEEAQQNQKGDPWELMAERAVAENATTTQACNNCMHEDLGLDEEPCESCMFIPDTKTYTGWEPKVKQGESFKVEELDRETFKTWCGEEYATTDCPWK